MVGPRPALTGIPFQGTISGFVRSISSALYSPRWLETESKVGSETRTWSEGFRAAR